VRIGELARATGATPRALRHYEQAGLITSQRAPNGYRTYDEHAAVPHSTTPRRPLGSAPVRQLPIQDRQQLLIRVHASRRVAWMRALAKAIQMASDRFRRSPEFGWLMVAGVMRALWVVVMSPGPCASCGQRGIGVPSLA